MPPDPARESQTRNDQTDDRPAATEDRQEKKAWAQLGAYAHLAVMLPLATIIGWAIGVGLDHWLHTTWLYLVGLILGIVAGFVDLVRTATKAQ